MQGLGCSSDHHKGVCHQIFRLSFHRFPWSVPAKPLFGAGCNYPLCCCGCPGWLCTGAGRCVLRNHCEEEWYGATHRICVPKHPATTSERCRCACDRRTSASSKWKVRHARQLSTTESGPSPDPPG